MSVTSTHLLNVTAAVVAGAHPVLSAGPGDLVVVDGAVHTQRFGIRAALLDAGIEHVLQFDPADGFRDARDRRAARAVLARAVGEEEAGVQLDSRSALDVADVAASLLAHADDPFAVVIYDADVLFGDPSPTTQTALVRLRGAAQNARCVARDVPLPPRNVLVLVRGGGPLPPPLELLPGARAIAVGPPTERERRAALEGLGPHFHGAGELDDRERGAALDALARRTALQPLTALEQIRRASVHRTIPLTRTRGLVDTLGGSAAEVRTSAGDDRVAAVLRSAIVGQDHVLDPIIERIALRAVPDAMYDPEGTTARPELFVLLGTPGGGKTDLAQQLALALFGSPDMAFVIRGNSMKLDHETASITGAPSGYTGYRDGQSLGEQVAGLDEFLLLVDEFDRANRNVLEMLLSVFEEGRLPTSRSTSVDMHNCVVVLTSNQGSEELMARIRADRVAPPLDEIVAIHRRALELVLTSSEGEDARDIAALWSRIKSRVLVYDVLRDEAIAALSGKFADWVVLNAEHNWPLTISYDEAGLAAAVRARLGLEGTWDARDVRSLVDELLHDPLRRAVVGGTVVRGSRVRVAYADGRPTIDPPGAARAA
jgi:MoxR-like ATPase